MTSDSAPEPASGRVASLAAHYFAMARRQAARADAPAELIADVAAVGELTAQIDALAAIAHAVSMAARSLPGG